jgi:hypothetical protein
VSMILYIEAFPSEARHAWSSEPRPAVRHSRSAEGETPENSRRRRGEVVCWKEEVILRGYMLVERWDLDGWWNGGRDIGLGMGKRRLEGREISKGCWRLDEML